MRRLALALIVAAALALSAGTFASFLGLAPKTPAPRAKLERISYHVMGGFAPMDRWVEVKPSGEVHSYDRRAGKLTNEKRGRLTAAQMATLAAAFRGWESLKARYMPERPVPDGQVRELRYGRKAVMAGDGAESIPAEFTRAEQALRTAVEKALGGSAGGKRTPR